MIMQYVSAFFKFWQDFIIGEDWTIAATVVWGVALIFGLVGAFVNSWYLLPIIIAGSIGWSVWGVLASNLKSTRVSLMKMIISKLLRKTLWLPMAVVIITPLVAYQLNSNVSVPMSIFLLSVTLNFFVVTMLALITSPLYRIRPLSVSLVSAFMSVWLLLDRVQPRLQELATQIDAKPYLSRNLMVLLLIVVTLSALSWLLRISLE